MDVKYVNDRKTERLRPDVEGKKEGVFAPREENFGTEYSAPPEKKVEAARTNLLSSISPLAYPPDLTDEFYIEFNAFKANTSRALEAKRTFNFEKSVYLPFPQSVTDEYGASYNEEALNFTGDFAKRSLDAAMTSESGTKKVANLLPGGGAADRLGRILADAANKAKDAPRESLAAVATFGLTGMGGPYASAAKSTLQVTTNPYPVMIYQGPGGFKSFAFSWTFFPESSKESDTIKKIIGYFRREMLPERVEEAPSILKYPAIFEIVMQPEVKLFKRCVISNLSVNYTPSGPAFVKEFPVESSNFIEPAAINMTVTFREIEMWTANDFHSEESKNFYYNDPKATRKYV